VPLPPPHSHRTTGDHLAHREGKVDRLESRLAEARCHIEDLHYERGDLQERMLAADARIDDLHAEKRSLQGRLIQANAEVEALQFANRLLEARLKGLLEHTLSRVEASKADTFDDDVRPELHLTDA
jgi:chromosome segregation ATPase